MDVPDQPLPGAGADRPGPGIRVRDIADRCLLTERAVQRIIAGLEQTDYLSHERRGRTNHYSVIDGKLFAVLLR
ncbi:hypothetical protein ACIRPK_22605 [Kitasatospora sp. NPDC101801]|uniref:hypothetical protein n=1 Tax=Kitasatospora sp. NPDC101801 TaxID=3364103 RepID=UPI0037FA0ADD